MHPFWHRLRKVMRKGELVPSDISEWFKIGYDKAFFWSRMLEGSRGPWPISNQREYLRQLEALELAVKERVFPLRVAPRERRRTVSKIRGQYHKRIPRARAAEPRLAMRGTQSRRPALPA